MSQATFQDWGYLNIVVTNSGLRALFRPMLGSDAAAYLRALSSVVAAASEEDLPSAMAKLEFPSRPESSVGRLLHPFTTWGTSYTRALHLHFRGVAGLRMAGTALAHRMYELDKGQPPARLEDLVPDYLAAVPKDPFDANGGPIRMGRWGGRELLYSLGGLGKDLGGQYAEDPNDPRYFNPHLYNWPYFLHGDGPRERIVKRTPQTTPSRDEAFPGGLPAGHAPTTIRP
jgi:hypothetical protein